jgi:hypothetical protein
MRAIHFLPVLLLAARCATAEDLSPTDREALLEKLEKIQKNAEDVVSQRFQIAVSAYRSAVASDTATMDLYNKCTEKVQFKDEYKKNQDFRDWKRKNDDQLSKPGFRLALRYQLNWLILTLEAASQPGKIPAMAPRVDQALQTIFSDVEQLNDGKEELDKSVTGTIFAKAYDLDKLQVDSWPLNPIDLKDIFDKILLPPLRKPTHITELRAMWMKRINYEGLMAEHWLKDTTKEQPEGVNRRNGKENDFGKQSKEEQEKRRIGTKEAIRSPEYDKFLSETRPDLLWDMEMDCYRAGDQRTASLHMLDHIQQYVNHKMATKWTTELQALLAEKEAKPLINPSDKPSGSP